MTTTLASQLVVTETVEIISTPPGETVRQQVLWLLETNNGCQLPCWWGIVPGQTEWSIAEEFLHRFDRDTFEIPLNPDLTYYGVSVPLPFELSAGDNTELGILVQNGIVERIQTGVSIGDTPPGYLNHYTLSSFLTTYGPPTEVWLSTYSSPPGGGPGSTILPFVVVMFYPDQGIAALYDDLGEIVGDMVRGCPQAYPISTLELWTPNLGLTLEELVNSSASFNMEYLSLEEATGMDEATFYETFKNPDNTTCLETPASLWR
jgi:hypothetical protein